MSGDVQPRKRKDKKRKKDDEDTVKETPAPKVTSGAAQAASQPGDIQMHVHNDHGTGGNWCAKIVFFILLAGLGALIGMIMFENRDLSNADTPLSESRFAEYLEGWVDENREDDHHHEEILEALNQLDDHDDEDQAHGGEDHGDEDHDDEEGEDEDDGAPYAEEEDHDDERDLEDDEDEGELPKLDDDEVEEIVATEKKVAQQEAQAAADNDDDDESVVRNKQTADNDDDDDNDVENPADDDDDDADAIAKEIDQLADDDDDDDDDGKSPFDEEDDDDQLNDEPSYNKANADNDDDDDDNDNDDDFENFVDNDGGEEEYLAKLRKEQEERSQQKQQQEKDEPREQSSLVVQILVGAALIGAARIVLMPSSRGSTPQPQPTSSQTAPSNSTYHQSQEETLEEPAVGSLNERLLRSEMAAANLVEKADRIEELLSPTLGIPQPRPIVEDFINAGQSDDVEYIEGNVILMQGDQGELYSGDEDEEYDYEQEEYGEELEEIEEEEEEEFDEEAERKLEEQEREIGSFVPTTFEEFSSMYRVPSGMQTNESIPMPSETLAPEPTTAPSETFKNDSPKSVHKESPLMKKKPPKGALNKLIYGLHKEPLITAEDLQHPMEQGETQGVPTAMYSDIHSPPHYEPVQDPRPEPSASEHSIASIKILTTTITPDPEPESAIEAAHASTSQSAREKHVEFLLPEDAPAVPLPEEDLSMVQPEEVIDNGSKENLFIPYDEGDADESYEDELIYEDEEELDSVLLRQYPSDEEEEPFSDDEVSDVDDSELMKRLEEKYGKLEVKKDPEAQPQDDDDEDSWTSIPSHRLGNSRLDGARVPSF